MTADKSLAGLRSSHVFAEAAGELRSACVAAARSCTSKAAWRRRWQGPTQMISCGTPGVCCLIKLEDTAGDGSHRPQLSAVAWGSLPCAAPTRFNVADVTVRLLMPEQCSAQCITARTILASVRQR